MKGLLVLALTALGSLAAQRVDAEVYGGIGVGRSEYAVSKNSDTSFSIFAAIRLTNRIMLEGGPVYPGRALVSEPSTIGFSIQAVGLFPVGERTEFLAKAGFYDWEVQRETVNFDDGRDPLLGIGLQRYIDDDLALRIEFNRFADVRGGNLDLISFGVVRWFRGLAN